MTERDKLLQHLQEAEKIVAAWPEWKRNIAEQLFPKTKDIVFTKEHIEIVKKALEYAWGYESGSFLNPKGRVVEALDSLVNAKEDGKMEDTHTNKGEPCNLSVFEDDKDKADKLKCWTPIVKELAYVSELGIVRVVEFFPQEIVHVSPINNASRIFSTYTDRLLQVKPEHWWITVVLGTQWSAKYTDKDTIEIRSTDTSKWTYSQHAGLVVCDKLGIPVMPFKYGEED
jgi:hypothetical protein